MPDCPLNSSLHCSNWVCTKHGCQRLCGSTFSVTAKKEAKPMIDKNKQYKTRQGEEVRIYAVDGDDEMPIHGAVLTKHGWKVNSWARDGRWSLNMTDAVDLIEVKPRIQREVWVNVYPHHVHSFSSKHDAESGKHSARIACVRLTIDCEEGEGL